MRPLNGGQKWKANSAPEFLNQKPHMNYELAKQLKNAGFPQEPKIDISGIDGEFFGGFYYVVKPGIEEVAPNFLDQRQYDQYLQSASDPITPANNPPELVKNPTLSELIAVCGSDIYQLERQYDGTWWAIGKLKFGKPFHKGDSIETGATPEEAVALLWLAINKPI